MTPPDPPTRPPPTPLAFPPTTPGQRSPPTPPTSHPPNATARKIGADLLTVEQAMIDPAETMRSAEDLQAAVRTRSAVERDHS